VGTEPYFGESFLKRVYSKVKPITKLYEKFCWRMEKTVRKTAFHYIVEVVLCLTIWTCRKMILCIENVSEKVTIVRF